MKPDIRYIARRVQETLNNLFNESLIPFRLTVYQVTDEGAGAFLVCFYDVRLYSLRFFLEDGGSLTEALRSSVLARVQAMIPPETSLEHQAA
jgi:hypothetical protein